MHFCRQQCSAVHCIAWFGVGAGYLQGLVSGSGGLHSKWKVAYKYRVISSLPPHLLSSHSFLCTPCRRPSHILLIFSQSPPCQRRRASTSHRSQAGRASTVTCRRYLPRLHAWWRSWRGRRWLSQNYRRREWFKTCVCCRTLKNTLLTAMHVCSRARWQPVMPCRAQVDFNLWCKNFSEIIKL